MLIKKDSLKNEVKSSKKTTSTEPQTTPPSQTKPNKTYTPKQDYDESNKKPQQKTCLTIKYNCGYGNQLYIRGKGAQLSWDKGTPLKNRKADEWTWETDSSFNQCEFKILINDKTYENGENHQLNQGSNLVYTPSFSQ